MGFEKNLIPENLRDRRRESEVKGVWERVSEETLEIISKDRNFVFCSLEESKKGNVYPIRSMLE